MSVPATAEPQGSPQGTEAPSTGQAGAIPAQEQRADPTQVSSAETQEQAPRGPDYIRDAFRQMRGYTQTAAPAPSQVEVRNAASPAPQAPPASGSPVQESERSVSPERNGSATTFPGQQQARPATASGQAPQGQGQITLSEVELQRRVQAEADRILAKQQKDNATREAQEQERELRRTDPFQYARMMEDREAQLEASKAETQRLTEVIGSQLHFYDRAVLDTFVGALPEADRSRVIAPDGDGIENRRATAANTLKALRSRWVAEGRASAKADLLKDQTFIKEVLARYGQAGTEPQPAPVAARSASGAAPEDGNAAMNSWMRAGASTARSTT